MQFYRTNFFESGAEQGRPHAQQSDKRLYRKKAFRSNPGSPLEVSIYFRRSTLPLLEIAQ